MILTGDLHLDDKPENEYRWQIFDVLREEIGKEHPTNHLFILGDITDRANKHSAALVNRLIHELSSFPYITVLAGNHDAVPAGPYFFEFINRLSGHVAYLTEPNSYANGLALFPWSANPQADWKPFLAKNPKAVFMHQPVNGVVGENGFKLTDIEGLPIFPRGCKIYSGDIHTPQTVGRITYVGAPYHIKFGDTYPTRILRLDNDFNITEEIKTNFPDKKLIEIQGQFGLADVRSRAGDQVKLRVSIPAEKMSMWPAMQVEIQEWAKERRLTISSVEAIVDLPAAMQQPDHEVEKHGVYDPVSVLSDFAKKEGLEDDKLLTFGFDLLHEELDAQDQG